MIHTGDCIEVMRGMPADSVDAVVTDPPYGIRFMGKSWDGADIDTAARRDAETRKSLGPHSESRPGRVEPRSSSAFGAPSSQAGAYDFSRNGNVSFQAWCQRWGTEALRVTKPGGYLLAFGGTRTHHRLVCGLEDAGWIIRDELDWIYASGFPKGKANLKPAHEPIVLARKPGPLRPLGIDAARIPHGGELEPGLYKTNPGEFGQNAGWNSHVNKDHWYDPSGGRWPSNLLLSTPALFDEPNPYVVGSGATAPSAGTYLNPDEPPEVGKRGGGNAGFLAGSEKSRFNNYAGDTGGYSRFFAIPRMTIQCEKCGGEFDLRYPRDAQDWHYGYDCQEREDDDGLPEPYPRFFIVPKSSRADREPVVLPDGHDRSKRFSTHPTQKPTDLMAHLIRLVCPPDGVILDPFLGSGSTAVAAEREGVKWIGIEKEPEYVAIAEARLNGTQRGLGLDVAAPTRRGTVGMHSPVAWQQRNAERIYKFFESGDEEPVA